MGASFRHHSEIDLKKWDALVYSSSNAGIYSTSHYLNATCKNWYVYMDDDYKFGIPIGVKSKLSVMNVYPPYFHGYSELVGSIDHNDNHFEKALKKKFSSGVLHIKQEVLNNTQQENYVYQVIDDKSYKLKSLAKRMLNKFDDSDYDMIIDNDYAYSVLALAKKELSKKLNIYSKNVAQNLDRLITDTPSNINIITIALKQNDILVGGVIGLKFKNTILYLKGTATQEAKNNGGMYALINALIHEAIDNNLKFDFGGSRNKGVRFFNRRFNAEDVTYYCYRWDKSPRWYKVLRKLYHLLKKQ